MFLENKLTDPSCSMSKKARNEGSIGIVLPNEHKEETLEYLMEHQNSDDEIPTSFEESLSMLKCNKFTKGNKDTKPITDFMLGCLQRSRTKMRRLRKHVLILKNHKSGCVELMPGSGVFIQEKTLTRMRTYR